MKLTARQRILLLFLKERTPREVIEICDILQVRRGTIGPVIADLVNLGILIKLPIVKRYGGGAKFNYLLPRKSIDTAIKEVGEVW